MGTITSAARLAGLAKSERETEERPEAYEAPPSRFDIAAERAMSKHSAAEWALLEPGERTDSIYAELRRLDAEFSRKRSSGSPKR